MSSIKGYLAHDVLDIPINGPVVYLTRDLIDGVSLPVVDVWIKRPKRCVCTDGVTSVLWRGQDDADDGALGSYTEAAVRARYNMLPAADECIVFDNPRVN